MSNVVDVLAEEWGESGIESGDLVLLHSNITPILIKFRRLKKQIDPELILESFLKIVGTTGTLMLPLFNFDFAKGIGFDLNNTPSQMGVLTEVARRHSLAVRTGHPIYSFAVIGAKSAMFREVNNFSGYGDDSPFGLIHKLNGKIAVLSLPDQGSMTFYHYIEEMNQVDYRYHKTFTGEYTGRSGHAETRTYGLFVRDIEKGVKTSVEPMGELIWEQGLYTGDRYNQGSGLRVVSAASMYDYVSEIIQSGRAKGLLYTLEGADDD